VIKPCSVKKLIANEYAEAIELFDVKNFVIEDDEEEHI
jgi:hypothetical protein